MKDNEDQIEFENLLNYIRRVRSFDFTGYKPSSLKRRILRRMQIMGVEGFATYRDYLEVHPGEFPFLFNMILINVTSFFREPAAWEYLAREIFPRIRAKKSDVDPIRIWSAGCASGEEPYSLVMVLAETLGAERFAQTVKIYATDVDEEALQEARHAIYTAKDLEAVPAELRDKYFERSGSQFVFDSNLRRAVIFGRHDLVQDAPISRLDLLVCRNTLMYFNAEIQEQILARFHFALNNDGYLFLGRAEMLFSHPNLFTPVELKHRIFTKLPSLNAHDRLFLPRPGGNADGNNHFTQQLRLREAAFQQSPVAQVVLDLNGNLAMANERARLVFNLKQNAIGEPFKDLELSYRPIELRASIEQIYTDRRTITIPNVKRQLMTGEVQFLDVRLALLLDNTGNALGVNISFEDITNYNRIQEDLHRSQAELETAYEELQSTNEELETTNEELQSSMEELETTNEELQSSNEELETMNEELQSSNEELQTLNDELGQRTDQLNRINAFTQSILQGLRDGAIVLDRNFNVLSWNTRSEDLWGVRADEVLGQSIFQLDIGLPVDQLTAPLRSSLAGSGENQETSVNAINRRGKSIRCRVVSTPLKIDGSAISGVIMLIEELPGS
ncbi:MAG: PAS domain S-box protein [Chloroflexi bacterium]|nr:PAS domain S-box protein [Chloroflexota bacterium]